MLFTSAESMMLHDWRLMGKTSLLMFPIYGMGALLAPIGRGVDRWLQVDQTPLRLQDRVMRHGVLYMVLIFTAEYCSGAWLKARGICPWDYTGRHSNINGLIRLDFAPPVVSHRTPVRAAQQKTTPLTLFCLAIPYENGIMYT